MHKEAEDGKGDGGGGEGALYVLGIGPGSSAHITARAKEVLGLVDCVVGYTRYLSLIEDLITGKETVSTGMTGERERCTAALDLAASGRSVAVVSSGDAGIYGMAGLVYELAASRGLTGLRMEVVPGVPAFVAASALLGAPLMHDFASISLSDLLTPWELIERRLEAAASADFVIALYNPKSSKRTEGLGRAVDIISRHRDPSTPVGIVRNATREDENTVVTTLGEVAAHYASIDMLTILIVGNSTTRASGPLMVTPRGYEIENASGGGG